jgi:FkbM family methyltransferase
VLLYVWNLNFKKGRISMSLPLQPTRFKSNPYEEAWFEQDFLHTGDGVGRFPKHPCKTTFNLSLPFIRNFRVALDIGCRDGEYARYLQHYFDHTYGFDSRIKGRFSFNVDLKKVTHYHCAIGDVAGKIEMYGGTHDRQHAPGYEIDCYPIDAFEIENIDYIKIDVEGYERRVILGATESIAKYKPVIVIEQNAVRLEDEEPFAAKRLLEEMGYKHVATCKRGWDHVMVPV